MEIIINKNRLLANSIYRNIVTQLAELDQNCIQYKDSIMYVPRKKKN